MIKKRKPHKSNKTHKQASPALVYQEDGTATFKDFVETSGQLLGVLGIFAAFQLSVGALLIIIAKIIN